MSLLEKYFAGWQFRSKTPTFEPGDVIVAFVTRTDGDRSIVRIGDSLLTLDQHVPADTRVRLRVTDFETSSNEGRAELVETLDTATF
ncbi:hypothetical protein ACFQJ5_10175 [Halomicroarcula sp. GCM10025324]|jgi:hypothetical protein|uniref:DUF7513 family protein n=1 Tax=Haloarcula TaxID=2237 RepID=UPI0023E8299D|nr:hypothetical protein [Halomicroarcula sp. ZS-22-S1]